MVALFDPLVSSARQAIEMIQLFLRGALIRTRMNGCSLDHHRGTEGMPIGIEDVQLAVADGWLAVLGPRQHLGAIELRHESTVYRDLDDQLVSVTDWPPCQHEALLDAERPVEVTPPLDLGTPACLSST